MYTTVLWATDGSPESDLALDEALDLLAPEGKLVAYHCDQRFLGSRLAGAPVLADEADRRRHVAAQVDALRARGVDAHLRMETTTGAPPTEIATAATEVGAEAIVCGTRALHGVGGLLTTSVASRLIRHATVPVIVVPPHAPTRTSALTTKVEAIR